MANKEFSEPNRSTNDPSGLRSALDLSGDLADKGWGDIEGFPPAADMSGGGDNNTPFRTSVNQGFSPNDQPVGGPPPAVVATSGGDDVGIPLQTLMNVGDEPSGPITGDADGVRSAVGSSVNE